MRRNKRISVVVLALIVASMAGCGYGFGGKSSTDVANMIGAESCDNSGYYLINYEDNNSHSTIYNCWKNNRYICVTIEHGIAHNETWAVKSLFEDILGEEKPACIS